jgi:N-acetylglucosamine kinase-like BadF-type ATPase
MPVVLGIDGGGSTLRAALVTETLEVAAIVESGSANPNLVGYDEALSRIAAAAHAAIRQVGIAPDAVGIGVAGASPVHQADWLYAAVERAAPGVPAALASDVEIALVGAHGARRGMLVLSGTGSSACGISAAGDLIQIGGWGYLIGDEGSGFWIGRAALDVYARWADGRLPEAEALAQALAVRLDLTQPYDLIDVIYRSRAPIPTIAALADVVLDQAGRGEPEAARIVAAAADALAALTLDVQARLLPETPPLAFAGGLLTRENALTRALCQRLGVAALPRPLYPPVIGAALLALALLK